MWVYCHAAPALSLFTRCRDNVWQPNLLTRLIHGATDEISFRDQQQWHRFPIRTCNSASRAWHQPNSTNIIWQNPRRKTGLFQLMERHLGFSGLCLPDWIVSYNLLIYSQSSLLRREMMPGKKEKHALLGESGIIQMGSSMTASDFFFTSLFFLSFPFKLKWRHVTFQLGMS